MSDQDFFFDEEDEKPAKPAAKADKPASKAPAKKAAASAKAEPAPAAPASFFDTPVAMSIVSMLVVCSVLAGLIVGVLVGQSKAATVVTTDAAATSGAALQNGQSAPTLTQEQMQSGQLPAGHPSIGGSANATGSAAASGTK